MVMKQLCFSLSLSDGVNMMVSFSKISIVVSGKFRN
jgi:hypothetical protein